MHSPEQPAGGAKDLVGAEELFGAEDLVDANSFVITEDLVSAGSFGGAEDLLCVNGFGGAKKDAGARGFVSAIVAKVGLSRSLELREGAGKSAPCVFQLPI